MRIVYDTETKPNDIIDNDYFLSKKYYYEKNPSYNYSLMNEDEKDNFIKSISFVMNKVTCICGKIFINDIVEPFSLYSENEENLIKVFVEEIVNKYNKNFLWVTYNGLNFDNPLIMRKCAKYDIKIKNQDFTNLIKFRKFPHFDCCAILSGWGNEIVSLEVASKFFNVANPKDGITNSKNILTSTPDDIKKYCMNDVDTTNSIYLKIKDVF